MNDLLAKGGNVSLMQRSSEDVSRLHAVVRWSDPDRADVDVSALLLRADGRVRDDDDFVFWRRCPRRSTAS